MSYTRDRDRYTRGVGAIAAADAGNPRRYAQRAARARALSERDRALSRLTYGVQGGLGARDEEPETRPTSTTAGGSGRPPSSTPVPPTRLYGGSGATPVAQANGAYPTPTRPGGTTGTIFPMTQPPTRVFTPQYPTGQPGRPVMTTEPEPLLSEPSGTVVSDGSGTPYRPPPSTGPLTEPNPLVQIPELDLATGQPGRPVPRGPDLKKVAMVAGAAAAVWWLFLRKRGTT